MKIGLCIVAVIVGIGLVIFGAGHMDAYHYHYSGWAGMSQLEWNTIISKYGIGNEVSPSTWGPSNGHWENRPDDYTMLSFDFWHDRYIPELAVPEWVWWESSEVKKCPNSYLWVVLGGLSLTSGTVPMGYLGIKRLGHYSKKRILGAS